MKLIAPFALLLILILLVGCSLEINEINSTKIEQEKIKKEIEYKKAITKLNENATTNKTIQDLDKRHGYLLKQIDKINETEFKMADFVRIKIELDFLKVSNYNKNKVNSLSKKFLQAFSEAEKAAKVDEDYSGLSLNDRYYSLERKIEKYSKGEIKLKVVEYLHLEEELDKLQKEGYIASRISDLRTKLLKSVISEVEFAIVDYQIPEEEIEEVKEEKVIEVVTEEVEEKPKKKVVKMISEGPEEELGVIKMIDGGFSTKILNINQGDNIVWENVRTGRIKIALVVGNRKCRDINSGFFNPGESYNWTFNQKGVCYVSDGIYTTQAMKITIS